MQGDVVAGTLRKTTALDDLKSQYGDRRWLGQLDVTDTAAIRDVQGRSAAVCRPGRCQIFSSARSR